MPLKKKKVLPNLFKKKEAPKVLPKKVTNKVDKKVIDKTKPKFGELRILPLNYKIANDPNQKFYKVVYSNNNKLGRDDIRKFAQQKSDKLKNSGVDSKLFSVCFDFGKNQRGEEQYKSGNLTATGSPVSIWDETDSDNWEHGTPVGFSIMFSMAK